MTDEQVALLSALLGQVLPPLIDVINRYLASAKLRFVASALVCLGAAAAMNFGRLRYGNLDQLLETALILFTSAQSAYHLYYKDSTVQIKLRSASPAEAVKLDSDTPAI